ncbi:MAG: B12-binding domain-containing radical SAM protein [Oscillospiraceae bacterium]|jgi:radical SAM superfamily enzyme YgiQ (UPF0313 family)|nr:B12-binding domain-containing radical SAM protein [Oscillospiraceae bacterium]
MKILLISPWDKRHNRYRSPLSALISYPPLTLPTLAALVPEELNAEISILDEISDKKLPKGHFDLVGITVIAAEAMRAYELADYYRSKGSFVVLGGYHTSFMQEEALSHADSIVVKDADLAWPELLNDFAAGRECKRIYSGEGAVPRHTAVPIRSVLKSASYAPVSTVMASRGCNNRCSFCSISRMAAYSSRDIDDVIAELKGLKHRTVIFYDPNFFSNREYAIALMEKMKPLKLHWGATATVDFGFDIPLLKASQQSGCTGVLIGFESLNSKALQGANKRFCQPERYKEAINNIHSHGMSINGTFVLGLESDDEESLLALPEGIRSLGIDLPIFFVMTPSPGTELYEQMQAEGRILTKDWSRYTQAEVVFMPKAMSPERLLELYRRAWRETYTIKNILKRVMNAPGKALWDKLIVVCMNVGFKFMGKDKPK